jgi:choline kinase
MTKKLPKCLIPLHKKSENLLSRYLECFRKLGLRDVFLVVGHQKEKIEKEAKRKGKGLRIHFIENKDYKKGSVLSLDRALQELSGDLLIMDADVYFPKEALKRLLQSSHRTSFLVDTSSKSSGEEMMLMAKADRLVRLSKKLDPSLRALGENIGFLKIHRKDTPILKKAVSRLIKKGNTACEYEESYNELMSKRKVGVVPIRGLFWTEMDFERDLEKILKHLKRESGNQGIRD